MADPLFPRRMPPKPLQVAELRKKDISKPMLRILTPSSFSLVVLLMFAALAGKDAFAVGGSYDTRTEVVSGADGQSLPAELVDVGIVEHLGAPVPLDAAFKDENGKDVTLGSYFKPGKPVLLNFAYYQCPMLCNMVLNGMLTGMKKLPWTPGNEFEIVTISI